VRARKAAQYSSSIDDFARIMKEGNNGGYANTWLIADIGKNEIGQLELGLKNVTLERKKTAILSDRTSRSTKSSFAKRPTSTRMI